MARKNPDRHRREATRRAADAVRTARTRAAAAAAQEAHRPTSTEASQALTAALTEAGLPDLAARAARLEFDENWAPDAPSALNGSRCRCGKVITTRPGQILVGGDKRLTAGDIWTAEEQRAAGACLWRRTGIRWTGECTP